jgi:hypothetical protein
MVANISPATRALPLYSQFNGHGTAIHVRDLRDAAIQAQKSCAALPPRPNRVQVARQSFVNDALEQQLDLDRGAFARRVVVGSLVVGPMAGRRGGIAIGGFVGPIAIGGIHVPRRGSLVRHSGPCPWPAMPIRIQRRVPPRSK